MFRKFIKYILAPDSLATTAVWVTFGFAYAAINPPFLKNLPWGMFVGACIVCLIGVSRQLAAYTGYRADRKRAEKRNDQEYLKNITKNYHSTRNPWLPAGCLLLILAGVLFLFIH
ncbi:MAG: hypothetical protein IKG46_10660 [Solobacterium sp.]|nr:hypothetical protein [Solobacterium sp.]